MSTRSIAKINTIEILMIIIISLLLTIAMDFLDGYERLQLFIVNNNLTLFDEFIVFFPAFIAMGFIILSFKHLQELGLEIRRRQEAEAALLESEKNYRQLSITDELTGLFNQRHFFYRLQAEIDRLERYAKPLSIMLLDLDNFKKYNDTFGHLEGDTVLRETGQIISSSIRSADLAFRYGGEEFIVILPETQGQTACIVAERIRTTLKDKKFLPKVEKITPQHVTVSIGVAT